jgi:hypothetical protein
MLKLFARPFADWSAFRAAWAILGFWLTYALLPVAVHAIYHGVLAPYVEDHAADTSPAYRLGAIGFGALLGLGAAWCRVLISNQWYQRSPALFHLTVAGLAVGITAAVLQLAVGSLLLHWFYIFVALLGALLLGATIGARTPMATPGHLVR